MRSIKRVLRCPHLYLKVHRNNAEEDRLCRGVSIIDGRGYRETEVSAGSKGVWKQQKKTFHQHGLVSTSVSVEQSKKGNVVPRGKRLPFLIGKGGVYGRQARTSRLHCIPSRPPPHGFNPKTIDLST